ncbi:hypothetical protein [Halobaculum sp. D14]|uniref:hypothetical protein n=1 Tax=unclassified Halobaculum TaxID=2640896 RepID=UPI003EBF51AC
MGLSVSASSAVVFLGVFLAAGILYPAAANGAEQVTEAHHAARDRALDQQNTHITVTNATYYDGNSTLVVTAENDGTTSLSLDHVDLFADNSYVTVPPENVTVAGDAATSLWLPGETARFEVGLPSEPSRSSVVVDHGVSDAEEVA